MKNKELKKLTYEELRDEIHFILTKFFAYEIICAKDNEFDFEFMEHRTDDILRLI